MVLGGYCSLPPNYWPGPDGTLAVGPSVDQGTVADDEYLTEACSVLENGVCEREKGRERKRRETRGRERGSTRERGAGRTERVKYSFSFARQ